MNGKHLVSLLKTVLILIVIVLLVNPLPMRSSAQAALEFTEDTACRFGINAPLNIEGYDIASLGVGSLLDWGAATNPTLPEGVEYIRVLRLRDDLYPQTLANLPTWVADYPGSVWVVGNEPDTTYEDQDALLAEDYADRYYEVAKIIRQLDRTAQIAFGTVVQPTPIRMRYLERAWDRLAVDAGSYAAASKLVDIWAPHSFILNEGVGEWGTGVPPGFENDHGDAVIITDFTDTYSMTIFMDRIIAFRLWMEDLDERNKPLWITEYGSLFPPIDPPGGPDFYNVSDYDTALYMWNTFNFLLTASDTQSGMPADNFQLVQRWYWYSLNDHRYHFGGSVYNPDFPEFGPLITLVGQNLIGHQQEKLTPPDLLPLSLAIHPASYSQNRTRVNYRLDLTIGNNEFDDASCGTLYIYDGDPNNGGTLVVGPVFASAFRPDYGDALVTTYWRDAVPGMEYTLYACVEPVGIADTNPSDNCQPYTVYADLPSLNILPIVLR